MSKEKKRPEYQEIVMSMPDCAVVYEPLNGGEDFIFVDFNYAAERVDNIDKGNIIGKRLSEIFPRVKEFGLFEVLQRVCTSGEPEHFTVKLYKDERISGWRENYVFRISSGHIVSVYQDATEKKRAEEDLVKSRNQLSSAMKIAHLGAWEYDVESDIFTFNDAFYDIFHTNVEEVGGYQMSPADYAKRFLYPEDAALVGEEVRRCIETDDMNYTRQLEHRIVYADGKIGYIIVRFFVVKNNEGRTVKTYWINQDITDRRNIEQAMQTQLSQLQAFSKVSVGRELKMIELKKKIKELEERLGDS